MQKLRQRLIIGFTVMAIGATMLAPQSASAASNSLGVNPRRDYIVKPGQKLNDTMYVSNLSKTDDLNIDINLIDFGPQDETGTPKLLLTQKEPTRWSLKPYFTIAKNVTIGAGKSAQIPFSITIPAKVGGGSYYGAIKYSAAGDGTSTNNVGLTSSSATLVFVRVPGDANDAMLLKNFGAFTPNNDAKSGTYASFYAGQAPKYLAYRLTNNGNVAEAPSGSVVVKNIFGKQVKLFEKANPNSNIVLIDQTRRIDLCFNETKTKKNDPATGREIEETTCNASKLAPGRYTAKLALLYGDSANGSSSHELGAVTSFWYLPAWFIIVVVAVLLFLAFLVWLTIRVIRGNRRQFSNRR
jgi:hypothetical protein